MENIKNGVIKGIKQIYWHIIPLAVRKSIRNTIIEIKYGEKIRNEINEYKKSDEDEIKQEFEKISNRIKKNPISVYNYDFCDKYDMDKFAHQIKFDAEKKLYYGNWNGKKLYISRLYNTTQMAAKCLCGICMEQDMESPHRYVTENYPMTLGGVLLDIGGAEGFFALDCVNNYDHVYIFENNPLWIEALKYTYEEYKGKVEIIEKFVSDKTNEKEITIDDFLEKYQVIDKITIKIDVEGAEEKVLKGCKNTLGRAHEIALYIAGYHHAGDVQMIMKYLGGGSNMNYLKDI